MLPSLTPNQPNDEALTPASSLRFVGASPDHILSTSITNLRYVEGCVPESAASVLRAENAVRESFDRIHQAALKAMTDLQSLTAIAARRVGRSSEAQQRMKNLQERLTLLSTQSRDDSSSRETLRRVLDIATTTQDVYAQTTRTPAELAAVLATEPTYETREDYLAVETCVQAAFDCLLDDARRTMGKARTVATHLIKNMDDQETRTMIEQLNVVLSRAPFRVAAVPVESTPTSRGVTEAPPPPFAVAAPTSRKPFSHALKRDREDDRPRYNREPEADFSRTRTFSVKNMFGLLGE